MPEDCDAGSCGARAFAETYRTELRAEAPERGDALYQAFAARYDEVDPDGAADAERHQRAHGSSDGAGPTALAPAAHLGQDAFGPAPAQGSFTFEDGAAYLVWKIDRHSGVQIELTPWQTRHPILASSSAGLAALSRRRLSLNPASSPGGAATRRLRRLLADRQLGRHLGEAARQTSSICRSAAYAPRTRCNAAGRRALGVPGGSARLT